MCVTRITGEYTGLPHSFGTRPEAAWYREYIIDDKASTGSTVRLQKQGIEKSARKHCVTDQKAKVIKGKGKIGDAEFSFLAEYWGKVSLNCGIINPFHWYEQWTCYNLHTHTHTHTRTRTHTHTIWSANVIIKNIYKIMWTYYWQQFFNQLNNKTLTHTHI